MSAVYLSFIYCKRYWITSLFAYLLLILFFLSLLGLFSFFYLQHLGYKLLVQDQKSQEYKFNEQPKAPDFLTAKLYEISDIYCKMD